MILSRSRSLALGCALLLGAAAAGAANQDAPAAATPPASEETAQQPAPESTEAASEEAAEDKRICRYVKLDASSRRKTKVCRTVEEWRELNNIR